MIRDQTCTPEMIPLFQESLARNPCHLLIEFSVGNLAVETAAAAQNYMMTFFEARRAPNLKTPKSAEKIEYSNHPNIAPSAGKHFIQFMVNRFFEQLVAYKDKEIGKVVQIEAWFEKIQNALRDLLDDSSSVIQFDDKDYNFNIIQKGREKYNFNQLSDGYSRYTYACYAHIVSRKIDPICRTYSSAT